MKNFLMLALILISRFSYAEIKCDAKNLLPKFPQDEVDGVINYDLGKSFISYDSENQKINIFSSLTICGQDVTRSSPAPICDFINESNEEIIRYSIQCNQGSRWYSVGIFQVNTRNGKGSFNCHTVRDKRFRYQLSNCSI